MTADPSANPDEGGIFLLRVVESVPIAIINEVLRKAFNETGENSLRLADDHSIADKGNSTGTEVPIGSDWSSPFVGRTIEDVATLVHNVPQPLNRQHFAVLSLAEYQRNQKVMVYKMVDQEPQGIPCTAEEVSLHLVGYERGTWAESWRRWREEGRSL